MKFNNLLLLLLLTFNCDGVELKIEPSSVNKSLLYWLEYSRQMYHDYPEELDVGMCMATKFWKLIRYIEYPEVYDSEVIVKLVSLQHSSDPAKGSLDSTEKPINSSEPSKLASLVSGTSEEFKRIGRAGVGRKNVLSTIRRMDEASLELLLVDRVKDNLIIDGLIKLLRILVNVIQSVATLAKSSIILSCFWDYAYSKAIRWIDSHPEIY